MNHWEWILTKHATFSTDGQPSRVNIKRRIRSSKSGYVLSLCTKYNVANIVSTLQGIGKWVRKLRPWTRPVLRVLCSMVLRLKSIQCPQVESLRFTVSSTPSTMCSIIHRALFTTSASPVIGFILSETLSVQASLSENALCSVINVNCEERTCTFRYSCWEIHRLTRSLRAELVRNFLICFMG